MSEEGGANERKEYRGNIHEILNSLKIVLQNKHSIKMWANSWPNERSRKEVPNGYPCEESWQQRLKPTPQRHLMLCYHMVSSSPIKAPGKTCHCKPTLSTSALNIQQFLIKLIMSKWISYLLFRYAQQSFADQGECFWYMLS